MGKTPATVTLVCGRIISQSEVINLLLNPLNPEDNKGTIHDAGKRQMMLPYKSTGFFFIIGLKYLPWILLASGIHVNISQ